MKKHCAGLGITLTLLLALLIWFFNFFYFNDKLLTRARSQVGVQFDQALRNVHHPSANVKIYQGSESAVFDQVFRHMSRNGFPRHWSRAAVLEDYPTGVVVMFANEDDRVGVVVKSGS